MQAVILAAGMGKRLGKFTEDRTKCLVEVNGETILDRALSALLDAGLTRIAIVTGYRSEMLRDHVRRRYPDVSITLIENPDYDKTNNIYSLWLARDFLASDDTLLLEGDIVFQPEIIGELLDDPRPDLALVSKYESWMDGTVTLLGEDDSLYSFIDKKHFSWSETEHYFKTVNIYKFSKDFTNRHYLPFLDAYIRSFGQNEYYEQVLKVLVFLEHTGLRARRVDAHRWYEIDDARDLEMAEIRFAGAAEKLSRLQTRYGGYWRFPELTDFCYLVNPFFPPQRLLDELRSSLPDLLTQYPSGMAVQQSLAAGMFSVAPEQVLVGNGAAELIAAFLESEPGRIGVTVPVFDEYRVRVPDDRRVEFSCEENDYSYTAENLLRRATGRVETLVVVNPDNPSGHFLRKDEMLELLQGCEDRGIKLLVDESFADFAAEPLRHTFMDEAFLQRHPGLFVVKSISKSYGVPGLRLGVLASGDTRRVAELRKKIPVWNINSFGEFFMQIFEKYRADFVRSCDLLAEERERFAAKLSALPGMKIYPSQANYLLCRYSAAGDLEFTVADILREDGFLLKDLEGKHGFSKQDPSGDGFLRIAVRTPAENDRLLRALAVRCGVPPETIPFTEDNATPAPDSARRIRA